MRTKPIAVVLFVLAGCASNAPAPAPQPEPVQLPMLSGEPGVIAEQGTPRERARAHTELAAAYYELGNMGIALDEARIALASDATYAPAYNVLGLVHMDLREHGEAQASFERALAISPTDPDANHNYGWFLCQTGREEAASRFFQAAVRNPLYSTPQKSYTLAGLCALRRQDENEAIVNLERALRLEPNYLSAVMPLAQLRYRRGELPQAKALVTQFNRSVEPTAESLWLGLRIERRMGDKAAEATYASELRRRHPGSSEYQSMQKGSYE
jgi:type IV pilus assembly protein PilF